MGYDAWGKVRVRGDLKTDIGYTAQREDAGINLMFYRARYYSPALGRFLSADAMVPQAGTPQSLNRYTYVRNRPLNYIDPSGHKECEKSTDVGTCQGATPEERRRAQACVDIPGWCTPNAQGAAPLLETLGSILFEPLDWVLTARDCLGGDCSGVLLGLIPFVPGSARKVFNAVDAARALETAGDAAQTANKAAGLLQAAGTIDDIPLYSLDDVAARKWYHAQLDKILGQIDNSLPLREQARQAFQLRNQARQNARLLMENRQLATDLDFTDPLPTWQQMLKRAASKGYAGEDIYRYILERSTRSRPSIDAILGLVR